MCYLANLNVIFFNIVFNHLPYKGYHKYFYFMS